MSCHVSPPHPRVPPGLGCPIPDARHLPHSMATPGKMRGVCSVSAGISEIFISQNLTTSLTCSSSSVFAGAGVSTGAAEGLVGGKAEQSPAGWRQQQGRGRWGWLGLWGLGTCLSPTSFPQPAQPLPDATPCSVPSLPASSSVLAKVSHGVRCFLLLFPAGWEVGLLWPPGSGTGASLLLMMMPLKTLVYHVKLSLQEREGRAALHRCVQLQ